MSLQSRVRDFFKGAKNMIYGESLDKITDHNKISTDPEDYVRINEWLKYFKGDFENVKYLNTYGERKERQYVSLNMAQVASRRLASLLFNEQASIIVGGENSKQNKFIQGVLKNNSFAKNFERYLESALALGGLAMRPYVDGNEIKIAFIQAPLFYPIRNNTGDISGAVIAIQTKKSENQKTVTYTLLEIHEWIDKETYSITNELYRSKPDDEKIGERVKLSSLDIYADLQEHTEFKGLSRPLFTYLKPAGFNNKSINSALGMSIYANSLETLKQLNDAYDQYNWELLMGQRTVLVPEHFTGVTYFNDLTKQTKVRQTFDPNQNLFISLQGDQDDKNIEDLTSPIRADDYIKSINHFIKTFEMQTSLSSGTFSFDGQGLKTATEVVSENSMTYQTRNSHLTLIERSIKELIVSIFDLARSMDITPPGANKTPDFDDITVNFDDGIFTDKEKQLDYWIKAIGAGISSRELAMEKSLGLSEADALNELDKIKKETDLSDLVDSGADYGGQEPQA